MLACMKKLFMAFFSLFAVRAVGFLGRVKITNERAFSVTSTDLRHPFFYSFMEGNTFKTRAALRSAVGVILAACRFSKIAPLVVSAVSIFMVGFRHRPFSGSHKPYKTVCEVGVTAYANSYVLHFFVEVTRFFTGELFRPRRWFFNVASSAPEKFSGAWFVAKYFVNKRGRKIIARILTVCFAFFNHDGLSPLAARTGAVDHQPAGSHFIAPLAGGVYGR